MNILDDGVNEENGNLPPDCTQEDDFVVPEPSFSQTAILQENVSPYYKQMYQRKFYNEQNKENVQVHQQNVNQKQLPVFNTGLTDFYRQIHRETLSAFPLEQFSDGLREDIAYYPEEGHHVMYRPNPAMNKGTAVFSTGYFMKRVIDSISASTAGKVYKVTDQITGYKFDLNRNQIKKM
ncbi:uncharacterized protein [Mytilus edulis]|uniref:uncharacterized protein n=1 Tax=Mytilus edulis TaxID=6550 RepID=UPI0039F01B24